MRRHADTVDVAGVAFRLSCRYPKPGFWARRHSEFRVRRRADVAVGIVYDEQFRRGAAGDTVPDGPCVRRRGGSLLATTGYYRALVDLAAGRAAVRMAAGFDVGGLMRTLAALWLLERDTLLVRATRLEVGDGVILACGLEGSPAAGYLAVTERAGRVDTRLTPFRDLEGPAPGRHVARAVALWIPGTGTRPRAASRARALAALLSAVWQADRRRPALARTLDLAARIVGALECREVGDGARPGEGLALG